MTDTSYPGIPALPSKINPLIVLGLLLFFVNTLPWLGGAAGKQAAVLAIIAAGAGLLLLFRNCSISLKNLPFAFLFLYALYVNINIFVHVFSGGGNIIFNDLAEPVRVMGMLIFFILGAASSPDIRNSHLRVFFILFLLISGWLISGWIIGGAARSGIYDFYITRGGRFSGLMASVNYVWVSSIIMVVLVLSYHDKKFFRKWLLIFGVIGLSLATLLLSGSRTGIAGFLFALIVFFFFSGKTGRKNLVLSGILFIGLVFVFYDSMSDRFMKTFDRTADRIEELTSAIQNRDLTEVKAFEARISAWKSSREILAESLAFGHGSSKSGIRILDNSYLMTIYRYGVVGLSVEMMMYLSFLLICFRRVGRNSLYSLPICFLAAYSLSGFVSSPFYELKTPHILSFLIGWFSSVSPRIRFTKIKKHREECFENNKKTSLHVSC